MTVLAGRDPAGALLASVAEGDPKAMRALVTALTPTIRASVAGTLARSGTASRRAAHQEVEDIAQTVLLALFADRAALLAQWDPERGLGLSAYVSLLAKRETISVLRSRRRSPWTEDPTMTEDLDRHQTPGMGPESEIITRNMLQNVEAALRERVTPRGAELFDLIFLQGLAPEEVAVRTSLSAEAVYAWNSRLTRLVKDILADLRRTMPPPRFGRRPSGAMRAVNRTR